MLPEGVDPRSSILDRLSFDHRDRHILYRVVGIAEPVPRHLVGLRVAARVGRAGAQTQTADANARRELPATPRVWKRFVEQARDLPPVAGVDLDPDNGALTGPRVAANDDLTSPNDVAGLRLRDERADS